jgi:DNA polymerase I
MQFQILDANYAYDLSRQPVVQLFGKSDSGKTVICRVTGFRPYFYAGVHKGMIDQVSMALEAKGLGVEVVLRYEPIGYQTTPVQMLRITARDPKDVRTLRDEVASLPGVKAVYETDILFKNRFLIDRSLGGMGWADVDDALGIRREAETTSAPLRLEVECEGLHPAERELNAQLRCMAFDIECLPKGGEMPTPDDSPVIMISMAFDPPFLGQHDIVLAAKMLQCPPEDLGRDDVIGCADESDLLTRFFSTIREYDPDIIAGYNSNAFDIPYLDERSKRLGIDARIGRDGSPWIIRKVSTVNNVAATGRIIVDLLPIIRSSFSLKQYTLRTAAFELLKMEKHDVDPKEMEAIWLEGGQRFRSFISYARRDAVLALRLLQDLRLMDKYVALSRASGSLLQDVVNGGQSGMVESLLLRRFKEFNRVVPPKPDSDESTDRYEDGDELKGGAVLVPEKGLLEDIIILDYKSLYPTIMMAHNLCYSTVLSHANSQGGGRSPAAVCSGEAGSAPGDIIRSPSGGEFVGPSISRGIVPGVLKELLEQRTKTKRLMKSANDEERRFLDAKQYAMKILLNSFYGYSGYARARLYSLSLANAVTSFGRENIVRTKEMIEAIGRIYILDGAAVLLEEVSSVSGGRPQGRGKGFDLKVVYGDTDSVFVRIERNDLVDSRAKKEKGETEGSGSESMVSPDDALLIGRKIAEVITARLPDPMELVFEAFARRGVFLAKKRYALWVFEQSGGGWKDRIKVRGMETVRRDWCELTSKTLNRCLELLLKEGDVDEAVNHVRDVLGRVISMDIKKDLELLSDLTMTRKYSKSPSAYKSKQPHIQLVEKMKKRGGRCPGIGDRVPFVIVRAGKKDLFVDRAEDPEYALQNNRQIDTDYYIEKQLLPPLLRIFASFGIKREQLVKDKRQRNLLDFDASDSKPQRQRSLLEY